LQHVIRLVAAVFDLNKRRRAKAVESAKSANMAKLEGVTCHTPRIGWLSRALDLPRYARATGKNPHAQPADDASAGQTKHVVDPIHDIGVATEQRLGYFV